MHAQHAPSTKMENQNKETVIYAKISPKLVNLRDIAGNAEEEEVSHWYDPFLKNPGSDPLSPALSADAFPQSHRGPPCQRPARERQPKRSYRVHTTELYTMVVYRAQWSTVIRMEDNRLPKQLMFGELASGKRKQGRPLKRFKDCVKADISHAEITT